MAGTALVAASSILTGLVYAVPARADDPVPDPDEGYVRISLGQQARMDRCLAGVALHVGGPALKAASVKALTGTQADLTAAVNGATSGLGTLGTALRQDKQGALDYVKTSRDRMARWEAANKVYAETGWDSGTSYQAPEFGKDILAFTLGPQSDLYAKLGEEGRSLPTSASINKAKEIAKEIEGKDAWDDYAAADMIRSAESPSVRFPDPTASDLASFLRHGGFPTTAPAPDSAEYRMEVEALKVAWGACDSFNPIDARRVLSPVVVTAHSEWENEYAAVAKPRADIIAAEVSASAEARKATDTMIEAIGQAWLSEQILLWQKYWAGRPKDDINRPALSVFAKAKVDLTTAQLKASTQLSIAKGAVAAAKTASDKVTTAQNSAYAIADAAQTPRGRGLLYAQQSAQVAKASYAAAQAAQKATEAAINAAKATAADSKALFALAQTQAHAINTEFRKAAAQEAAAQAKAAAAAADKQAKEAAANATKAKTAQATAESAEETARVSAAEAKKQRGIAEAEKANASRERATAASERAKAGEAEGRAQTARTEASDARGRADDAGSTAAAKRRDAENAEHRAYLARDAAQEAERKKQATASRAAALEAAAAAAEGTDAAKETRAAATEARTAANDASSAATRARSAADDAGTAAVNARAAATRAGAAASRSRAAADKSWSAYLTTHQAAQTAHAAAAEAIDAAGAAQKNAENAEAEAQKARAAAVRARQEANAAKAEAAETAAWAAKTAGYAFAAGQAASAARDSATEVIKPANEAIAIGTAYKESDTAAAFAVLAGQTSKTMAEQQAAAAKAKADEAVKAAATAKALADKAAGDAKIAAQAAAAAAADAAKALTSVAAARASAAQAATAAQAAQKADSNAQKYDAQAGTDAVYAGHAANEAESEAAAANREATDAERDAASARSAATEAAKDAASARDTAGKAETDATAAEKSAENADGAAKDADAAATRAEAEDRRRKAAERAARIAEGSPDSGSDLSTDEEALLRAECGQTCVDEFRAVKNMTSKDVIDWVKENGGEILLEVFGVDNIKKCLSDPDIESCLWALVDAGSIVVAIGKLPAVSKAIYRVVNGIDTFFETTSTAKRTLERYRKLVDKLKRDKDVPKPPCLAVASSVSYASFSTASASSGGKWNLPCGFDVPELDERALDDIREYHVPGGSSVTRKKGLFKRDISNSDLHRIFEKCMESPMRGPNESHYYERVCDVSDDVGFTSEDQGSDPTSWVMLVHSKYGDVITMFPIPRP